MLRSKRDHKDKTMILIRVFLLITALVLFQLLTRQWSVDGADGIEIAE